LKKQKTPKRLAVAAYTARCLRTIIPFIASVRPVKNIPKLPWVKMLVFLVVNFIASNFYLFYPRNRKVNKNIVLFTVQKRQISRSVYDYRNRPLRPHITYVGNDRHGTAHRPNIIRLL